MFRKNSFISIVALILLFCQLSSECSADAAGELEQAQNYFKQGDFQQAERIYRSLVTGYPGTDYAFQAQAGLALMYAASDMYDEAAAAADKLIDDFPRHPTLSGKLAEIAERCEWHSQFAEAVRFYEKLAQSCPETDLGRKAQVDICSCRAASFIRSDRYDKAASAVQQLILDFGDHPYLGSGLYRIARQYTAQIYFCSPLCGAVAAL